MTDINEGIEHIATAIDRLATVLEYFAGAPDKVPPVPPHPTLDPATSTLATIKETQAETELKVVEEPTRLYTKDMVRARFVELNARGATKALIDLLAADSYKHLDEVPTEEYAKMMARMDVIEAEL